MTYAFSGGPLASLIILAILVALPVRLAAGFADARRPGIFWCCGAVLVGVAAGYVAAVLLGGYIGGPLAGLLGFVLGIRVMLGTSFAGALGLSIIAFALSLAGFALLVKLGIIATVATSGGVAI